MLRAVSSICIETQALELLTASRRDVFKVFRAATLFSTAPSNQTVLSSPPAGSGGTPQPPRPPHAPHPPPPPPRGRAWLAATTAAIAVTASIGGIYFYRKYNEDKNDRLHTEKSGAAAESEAPLVSEPAEASALPAHVEYLLVGGGTAAFAALRALRAAQPGARVLLVTAEHALPYMRPPLSKELWREPGLAADAAGLDTLTFAQWNGKRRSLLYEPDAFYTPVARLAAGDAGAGVARGWTVRRLRVADHVAELTDAGGSQCASVAYDKCLVATGVRPRHASALWAAGGAGRAGRVHAVRGVRDVRALATALSQHRAPTLAVVGGGFLASELSASIADTLKPDGGRVVQIFREGAALARVLPDYLAADASSRLRERGVTVLPNSEVVSSRIDEENRVVLSLADGAALTADVVLECVGSEVDESLARASGLELHPALGGLVVNAELQARHDVYAAGDAACFHDVALGRRRVEHHDHAVLSGRRAGANMAGDVRPYDHQSMFWSDLGPDLGFEAIGLVDSKLPTVGVFSEDAVLPHKAGAMAAAASALQPNADNADTRPQPAPSVSADTRPDASADTQAKRYERGVVFYLQDKRVVGVLLWNLFNRMHVARQVMAQGEFEDLFEVAKLFAPQDED